MSFVDNKLKTCSTCKIQKSNSEFNKNKQRPDGLHYSCKTCMKKTADKRIKSDPEAHRAKQRKYYAKNPHMFNNNAEKRRAIHLLYSYNMTPQDYEQMVKEQNNCCAICKQPEVRLTKKRTIRGLVIDHCHKTGSVRQLLCDRCNVGLGSLQDSIEVIENALNYLKLHSKKL